MCFVDDISFPSMAENDPRKGEVVRLKKERQDINCTLALVNKKVSCSVWIFNKTDSFASLGLLRSKIE